MRNILRYKASKTFLQSINVYSSETKVPMRTTYGQHKTVQEGQTRPGSTHNMVLAQLYSIISTLYCSAFTVVRYIKAVYKHFPSEMKVEGIYPS